MSNENDSKLNVAMIDAGTDLSGHKVDVSQLDSSTNISEGRSVVGQAGFNFLTQAGIVADLLKTAERVLSKPCPSRLQELENALRTFERFTAPVAYGVEDVAGIDPTLSLNEQLEALENYAHNYQTKDSDLYAIKYSIDIVRGNHN